MAFVNLAPSTPFPRETVGCISALIISLNLMEERKRRSDEKDFHSNKKKKNWKPSYKSQSLENLQGVLVSCESEHQDRAIKELYNLFNEYGEQFYPEIFSKIDAIEDEDEKEKDDVLSLEKSLEREMESLRKESTKSPRKRTFQALDTGCKGILFIAINEERIEPVSFIKRLLDDVMQKQIIKSRFVSKLIPITRTCHADLEQISQLSKKLIDSVLNSLPVQNKLRTYSVIYKARNNSGANRSQILEQVTKHVNRIKASVDLKNPEYVIIVEIIKTVCCITVTNEYNKYKRFNIREVVAKEIEHTSPTTTTTTHISKDDKEEEGCNDENESLIRS